MKELDYLQDGKSQKQDYWKDQDSAIDFLIAYSDLPVAPSQEMPRQKVALREE